MSGPDTVLERLARVTPLGVRFWDEATHAAIAEGLMVSVYPSGEPLRRTSARPNSINTFVLPQLPGPRIVEEEFGEGDDEFWKQVHPRPFVIEVIDQRGSYQPFVMTVSLPFRGHAVPPFVATGSPPSEVVPLFPTASRPIPAGIAVVRADLQTPLPPRPGEPRRLRPASWAVLEAQVGTLPPVRGVADREGRVAVLFPYPEPRPSPARPASPPYPGGTSLQEQKWPVRLTVFYEPETPTPDIPDLRRTLDQLPAVASIEDGGTRPLGDEELRYGQELIVRSVVVTPAGSPP